MFGGKVRFVVGKKFSGSEISNITADNVKRLLAGWYILCFSKYSRQEKALSEKGSLKLPGGEEKNPLNFLIGNTILTEKA